MSKQDDIDALMRFEPLRGVLHFTFHVYPADTIEDIIDRACPQAIDDVAQLLRQFKHLLEEAGFPHRKPWYVRLFQ